MAYFPHAFQKVLLATNGFEYTASQKSVDVDPGKVSIINYNTNDQIEVATAGVPGSLKDLPMIYLAQGSLHPNDKLGGSFHGGYKESIKSKGINPRFVSDFYVHVPQTAQGQKKVLGSTANPPLLKYNQVLSLRVDLKGSPALRFFQRNLYYTATGTTGCAPAGAAADAIADPAPVFEQWALELNTHPMLKDFILAKVLYDLTGDANPESATKPAGWAAADNDEKKVRLEVASIYAETAFNNNSWDRFDHFETEPLMIYLSVYDDLENPCLVPDFPVVETQEPRLPQGTGEKLIRELILDKRYRQEPYQSDWRMRGVLGDTTTSDINRNDFYHTYTIIHSIPRNLNPSGMFDADRYLIKIVATARNTGFENFMNGYLALADNPVQLKVMN